MYNTLEEIEDQVRLCKKCKLCIERKDISFGIGNCNSKIMFIGEGLCEEDSENQSLYGKSNKLMNQAFLGIGINKEEVYISNIVKCKTNSNPTKVEISACMDFLRNQVMIIKPKIIVLLGNLALKNILGEEFDITKSRGKWVEKKGILYMPTYHPAALLMNERLKIDFWNDLKLVCEKNKKMGQ